NQTPPKPPASGHTRMGPRGHPGVNEDPGSRGHPNPVHPTPAPPHQGNVRPAFDTFKSGLDDQPFPAEFPKPRWKDPLLPAAARAPSAHGFRPQVTARRE